MRRLVILATALFGLFLLWVIFQADTGRDTVFFRFARSVPLGDKIGHFFLYGFLAFGLHLSLRLRCFRLRGWKLPTGPTILLFVVVAEEFSQAFIPYRTLDAGDLIADVLGVVLFTWLTCLPFFRRRFGLPENNPAS